MSIGESDGCVGSHRDDADASFRFASSTCGRRDVKETVMTPYTGDNFHEEPERFILWETTSLVVCPSIMFQGLFDSPKASHQTGTTTKHSPVHAECDERLYRTNRTVLSVLIVTISRATRASPADVVLWIRPIPFQRHMNAGRQ